MHWESRRPHQGSAGHGDTAEAPRLKTVRTVAAGITGYNCVFACNENNAMEAEQINSIANKLDDLAQRADELRRYL